MLSNKNSAASTTQHRAFTKFVKCLAVLSLGLFLFACADGTSEISTTFANTQDIQKGSEVFFDDQVVGAVSDVVMQNNGSRVVIELVPGTLEKLTDKSALVVNRLKEGAPLEIYNRATGDGQALQAGQEIRGLDSMFQLGAWMVGDAIQLGAGSISHYVDSFQQYLQSDEFKQDKENIEIQIDGASVSAAQALEAVGDDLNRALEELVASENEISAAVDELGKELAPVVEQIGKSGSQLAIELEKFAAGLESTSESERQSGQKLLDSLVAMLEKLNSSMDQGMQQGVDDASQAEPADAPE